MDTGRCEHTENNSTIAANLAEVVLGHKQSNHCQMFGRHHSRCFKERLKEGNAMTL